MTKLTIKYPTATLYMENRSFIRSIQRRLKNKRTINSDKLNKKCSVISKGMPPYIMVVFISVFALLNVNEKVVPRLNALSTCTIPFIALTIL